MFYDNLIKLCEERGITVTSLLRELNLSTSKGTAWKNGSIPKYEILKKLANYFSVPLDQLFVEESKSNKKAIQDEEYDIIETIGSEGEHRILKVSKSQFDMIDTILKTMSKEQEEFEKKINPK